MALQVRGVLLAPHFWSPGLHSPPQLPLEQTFGQAVPGVHLPFWSQVSGVRVLGPPHLFVPGLQSPVHSPVPLQTFGQGAAAGVHSPAGLQLSGV